MHRISWTRGGRSESHFAPSGLFCFPSFVAESLGAYAVALVPRRALLLGAGGPVQLTAGIPWRHGSDELVWEPAPAPRLLRHAGETTQGDGQPHDDVPRVLTTWDGARYPIPDEPFVIGRHGACHLRLSDAHVSQFHCVLVAEEGAVRVYDLASTNGTYLDGVRVHQAAVHHRASLRVGRARMTLDTPARSGDDLLDLPSAAMRGVLAQAARVARTRAPVLVHGESGVGKDVLARFLHRASGRAGGFVAINAGALVPALAASELFGHARGAFTGAERDRNGAFLEAHEGTLFLDEVAELPPPVQAELLRAVDHGRVRRVGETHEIAADIRLVTATNRDLAAYVRGGHFREDLYHRLCVVLLHVPPLRERPEDIDALADHFLTAQETPRQLSTAARTRLHRHRWPGNVRELRNTLLRAGALAAGDRIEASDIVFTPAVHAAGELDELVRAEVMGVYAESQSVAATAQRLGLRRAVVHRVLRSERRASRRDPALANARDA